MAAMFTECNSGWKAQPDTAGGYDIVEAHDWSLATVNYDYRFTCNATNLSRASMMAAAPEMLDALQRVLRTCSELSEKTQLTVEQAVAKALGLLPPQ